MAVPDNIFFIPKRFFIIVAIGITLLLSSVTSNFCAAQSANDVELKFVKLNDSIVATDLCFNILKIWNNTSKRIVGNLAFNGPESWKIISFPGEQTILMPGDTVLVPMRISPVTNAQGGIAYIINATFRNSKILTSTSTYLTLPSVVKWDFALNKTSTYFTDVNPNSTFQIKLSNKGNTNELIKLKLEAGKLLTFIDNAPNNSVEYINLDAFKDTTILRTVTSQSKISFADKIRYENNWRESAISVSASDKLTEKSSAIQIYKLSNNYVNQRVQISSPLNIDYQMYNLMSSQAVRNSIKAYGSLLFPKNRELQYVLGAQNFSTTEQIPAFDVNRQLVYTLRYLDKYNNVQLGYNISGGLLHSVNGRGVTGIFNLNARNTISYAFTQNPYSHTVGEFVGFTKSFKKLSLTTEVTHDNRTDGSYQATSALLGFGFNFLKYNSLSIQVLGSQTDFKQTARLDTSILGFSYKLNYNVKYKKFNFRISSLNSEHNYILNSGQQQSYIDSKYLLADNVVLTLYGNHQKYAITRYPNNFYNPTNYNSNDNLRLTTSITSGDLIYQIGPNYNGSTRETYNAITHYKSSYVTYQPGVWCAVSIKIGGYRSITPNLTLNNIRFYYKTNDPSLDNYSFDKNIYYSAGLSYFDNVWRVNAYYTSGSSTDLYRSVLVDDKPTVSRSLQLRPSYENYFFNRTVKFSTYMNYAFYMPSGRENVSFNLKYDQVLKKGWNFSVSGFMYSNTRVDSEKGRISTKDLNVLIGISKTFNIQQPRLKYYDYKAIFFNDLDGNSVKSENEPPVTDILVGIEKDQAVSKGQSNIPEIKLITDASGSVGIDNLPKDSYKLYFTPLSNLQSLYFINGSEQSYYNDKTRTVYIPLAESYKIKGKIVLVRDVNSAEGKVDVGGVRITANSGSGETYSVLTDNFGAFVLSVPSADKYTVHINNVFGDQFYIETNEMQVQFAQNKTINLDFIFLEKKRGIQFEGGELFKFNSMSDESDSIASVVAQPVTAELAMDNESPILTQSYAIQLSAQKTYRDPAFFKKKYKLRDEVFYTDKGNIFKYYTGDYPTLKLAKEALAKLGVVNAVTKLVDRTLLKEARKQGQIKPTNTTISTPNDIYQSGESASLGDIDNAAITPQLTAANSNGGGLKQVASQSGGGVSMPSSFSNLTTLPTQQAKRTLSDVDSEQKNQSNGSGLASTVDKPNGRSVARNSSTTISDSSNGNIGGVNLSSASSTSVSGSGGVGSMNNNNDQASAIPNQKLRTENKQPKNMKLSNASGAKSTTEQQLLAEPVQAPAALTPDRANKAEIKIPFAADSRKLVPSPQVVENNRPSINKAMNQQTTPAIINQSAPRAREVAQSADEDGKYLYTIQLDASIVFRDVKYYKVKYNLPFDVISVEKDGKRRYYAGKYKTEDAAKVDIARYGMIGFIVPIEESMLK